MPRGVRVPTTVCALDGYFRCNKVHLNDRTVEGQAISDLSMLISDVLANISQLLRKPHRSPVTAIGITNSLLNLKVAMLEEHSLVLMNPI